MKKKTNVKTLIREIVREEVAMAIKEVVKEIKKPSINTSPMPMKRVVTKAIGKEVNFSNNPIINEVLNETTLDDEWKTMGGGTYDSSRASEVLASSYGDMMNDTSKPNGDQMVASMGANPETIRPDVKDALTKDYRGLMKALDKKDGK